MQNPIYTAVGVRAVTSQDEEGLRGMFSRLSPETIYLRFHMPYPRVPEWALGLLLNTNHYDGESLVAIAGDGVVGHAMYARLDGGKLLLRRLAERAIERGIEVIAFEVLGENRRMLGLADTVFAESRREIRDGSYYVRTPLRTSELVAEDHVPGSGCAA